MSAPRSWLPSRQPSSRRLLLAFALGALALLAGLGLLALSGWFISAAAVAGASAASAIVFDIFRPGALIRACAIVRTASRYGERLVSHDAVLHRLAELRLYAYRRLTRLAPEPLRRHADGDLLQRVVADIDTLDEGPLRVWLPLSWAILVAIASVLLLAIADASLAIIALPWLVAACLLVPLATAYQALRANRALGELAGLRRERAVESLRGLTTLLLCGGWRRYRRDWQALDQQVIDGRLRQRLIEAGGLAVVMLCIGAAAWVVLLRGQPLVATQALGTPMLAMAVLATLATLEAFAPTAAAMQAWSRTRAASARLDALLDQPALIRFVEPSDPPRVTAHGIRLDRVCYRHRAMPGDPRAATAGRTLQPDSFDPRMTHGDVTIAGVDAINLHITAGSRVVISGPSGSGKSTLAALLARTLDPQHGCIRVGEIDLRAWPEKELRSRVAVLDQRPHLFAMSLADNLRLADPTADDARLLAALDVVALGAFTRALPLGLSTPLGEYGLGLSGGEARRVALARTLLRNADIVILDEPFEGLDDANREHVVNAVDEWVGSASLIVISHHPIAFKNPTRRLSMSGGRIATDTANQID